MNKKWLKAGITTYVMMMLGFAIMFYLFGFTSIWDQYVDQPLTDNDNKSITDPQAVNLNTFLDLKTMLVVVVGGGGILIIGTWLLGSVFGVAGTLLQILFPIYLLLICNIFIFPVVPGGETHINDVYPLTYFLIGFFNLWFILAIVEFIRG